MRKTTTSTKSKQQTSQRKVPLLTLKDLTDVRGSGTGAKPNGSNSCDVCSHA
jgi:hypothetical protein